MTFSHRTLSQALSAALLACSVCAAQAAVLPVIDNFSVDEIDATLWQQGETTRLVDRGRLSMGRWSFGGTASSTGTTTDSVSLNATDDQPAKAIKVTITAVDLGRVDGCAANPTPSTTRARMISSFFSTRTGGAVSGDMTGDVLAQLALRYQSTQPDGTDILRVVGGVPLCTNSDCSTSIALGGVDLGTVALGTSTQLQIEWDRANKQFSFIRDGGTPVVVPYTVTRTGTPGRPFNQLSVRNEVANCAAGRVKAGMEAQFDNYGIKH